MPVIPNREGVRKAVQLPSDTFTQYILERIRLNKNFMMVITGPTGSGKTYSAMRIAEEVDPSFSVERVAFTPSQFIRMIQQDHPPGSAFVFDEAGVNLSAHEWMSTENKLMNFLFQTFRHKNYIVIFTTPHFGLMSKRTRMLVHTHATTEAIDVKRRTVRLRPLMLQLSQNEDKVYKKYLRVGMPGVRGRLKVRSWYVKHPSKELVSAYEFKKTVFTSSLNQRIYDELVVGSDSLTDAQQRVLSLIEDGKRFEDIAHELGINLSGVYRHVNYIKKKGFKIKPVREGSTVLFYEVVRP